MSPSAHRFREAARHAKTVVEATVASVDALVRPLSGREQASLDGQALTLTPTRRPVEPPRIVIDGVFFQLQETGIARVWRALMTQWSASGFARNIVVLDRMGTAPRLPGFTYRRAIPFRYHHSLAQSVALEAVCRAEKADIFVSTYYTTPLRTRSLLYLYDMIPEALGLDPNERAWREKRAAIAHASAYVAISDSTAGDLHLFYPSTGSRPLMVAHNAADPVFAPSAPAAIQALATGLGLPLDYFVFVGPRDVPYKNAALVLHALDLLPETGRPAVLFVGGAPTLEAEFRPGAGSATVRVARLSDEDLAAAYSGSLGLLYLSKYEGFGLPILEAMACGCPVVTCANSSIPEVAGDAAIYVAEDDPSELAAAMTRLRDPSVREEFRERGLQRVRGFDWKRTADQVERFIRDVAHSAGPED